jgi:eight-cysteine-cluster-containing protein
MFKKIIIIFGILILTWVFIKFVIGGPEDDWICVDGKWIEHGVPAAPKPTSGCGNGADKIINFFDCLEAGNPVMESYPRQCRTAEGELFIEEVEDNSNTEGFCGSSTDFSCSTSDDCQPAGCSGQICMGKDEEPIITTCEWRDCYDETIYDLSCQCLNSQCQWSK